MVVKLSSPLASDTCTRAGRSGSAGCWRRGIALAKRAKPATAVESAAPGHTRQGGCATAARFLTHIQLPLNAGCGSNAAIRRPAHHAPPATPLPASPPLLDCLPGYDRAPLRQGRRGRRADGGRGGAAAGHGLRHRLGAEARRRGCSPAIIAGSDHLGAGRQPGADRRSRRARHRHRVRHRGALWRGQPDPCRRAVGRAAVP